MCFTDIFYGTSLVSYKINHFFFSPLTGAWYVLFSRYLFFPHVIPRPTGPRTFDAFFTWFSASLFLPMLL